MVEESSHVSEQRCLRAARTMSSAEPVFYLGDSDESEDEGADVGVMHERRPLHQRRASVSRQTSAQSQRTRNNNNNNNVNGRSKASLTRSLWELEDRCAQLESEAERAATERELMTRKLIWLEESVRTLVGVSSRTSRIYWDWGKRDGSAAAAAAAAYFDAQYADNPRPRSQYEHAPRRDHAFNRQRLPPPPPPIASNGVPMPNGFHANDDEAPRDADDDAIINDDDDVAAASALADAADLAARVGAFLADSNRLLAQHGVAGVDSARVARNQNEDEFEALRSQVMLERNLLSQMHATRRQRQNAARRR